MPSRLPYRVQFFHAAPGMGETIAVIGLLASAVAIAGATRFTWTALALAIFAGVYLLATTVTISKAAERQIP